MTPQATRLRNEGRPYLNVPRPIRASPRVVSSNHVPGEGWKQLRSVDHRHSGNESDRWRGAVHPPRATASSNQPRHATRITPWLSLPDAGPAGMP